MNDLLGMIARILWISIGLLLLSCLTYGILCGLFGWNNKLNRPKRKDDEIIYIEPLDCDDFPEDKIEKALSHKPDLPKKHIPNHLRVYKPNESKV